ncbi:glycoside hydrolase family 140 protein [Mucilaginibacter sp. dw_454]|uniref:glycoside hydrolase family 140 protein n=1 Tax=Mucilaginibacter sp. dw_454 TaxID=2720079 RepID=UPI001BD3AC72|nr:glycoside hydrolase family 140 protein [Mucilaginibacter sp. dw_454]
MKKYLLSILLLAAQVSAFAQFTVSPDKHYILKDNQPFFWLGDTAWELFHRLNREDADFYLKHRSEQGFTVIQAVALAEFDGLNKPNVYGDEPLINNDPTTPNDKYFKHVDYIIDKAAECNLNVALLPTWGDKINKAWGVGPEIFNEKNAAIYAEWLAKRYKNRKNIIWILGGDRNPRNQTDIAIWRAVGLAIKKATNNKALITYHCSPNELGSAEWFRNESWFDFNMFQNGHCRDVTNYIKVYNAYNALPLKPVIDGEPLYEDHPICFNVADLGTSSAYDIRHYAYTDLFSGAFGHTYGCHDIWQMYSPNNEPINGPHVFWQKAIDLPGAKQMTFVKRLMVSHPILDRMPDQSLIVENDLPPMQRIQATRGKDYAFIYSSEGKPFTVNMGKISGDRIKATWFDPKSGKTTPAGEAENQGTKKFTPPSSGYGNDWVLVLDNSGKNYQL